MALTKCKKCGNDVSTRTRACPRCGEKKKWRLGVLLVGIVGAIVFIGWLLHLFNTPTSLLSTALTRDTTISEPDKETAPAELMRVKQVGSASSSAKAVSDANASSAFVSSRGATQGSKLSDLSMLRATVEQMASIENDFSASQVKYRELITYAILTKVPESEKDKVNAEFRQVMGSITTTLGRSKRVRAISLQNTEASRHLRDAVAAHKTWSATQSKKYSALFRGDPETALNLAKDDTAANAEAASLISAYKALGAEPFR